MVRSRASREVPFGRDPTKPTRQAEMAEDNLASYRTSAEAELSSFQTGWVEVKFGEKPILVSRRTFSEVVRSKLLTIVYNEKFDETTAPDDNQENNQNQTKKIVLVSFHPTTKTYEILIFQSPNGTTTTSPTKIDPLTEEGQAWIQCLQEAYPYFDFKKAEISPNYQKLAKTLTDQWMLEQLQQIEVSVSFKKREILVSLGTFSEVVKWGIIEIIYTTANDKEDEEKVIVSFNPITKTYQILTTRTNLSTEIEPSTEVGKAWIQCLQKAYPYYDFENAEISPNYQIAKTLTSQSMLKQLQQTEVSVSFKKREILVSRRTFWEVVKWGIIEIIYTTANGEKVIVRFNQTAETYEILYLPSPNSTTNSSPIKIDPATKEGKAWIQCLQKAYPYYDFENAEISPNYQKLAKTLIDQWILEQLQQIEVSVLFEKQEISVSRGTFSEAARSQAQIIIYTYYDNIGQEQIVFVGFNPTTKTYKILTTRTNSSTEKGETRIQCLQEAYPYFDFKNVEALEYKYKLLNSFPILLPKVIEREDDKLSAFNQTETVSLLYSRINYEELEISFPRLFWFDPYNHTHYTLLFDPKSSQYKLIYRYRKERSLYIVTLQIQVIDANTGHVSLVKTIIKQTKAPKPRDPTANQTPTSEDNDQAQQTKQNQVAKIAPDILDSLTENIISVLNLTKTKRHSQFVQAVIAQMMETLSTTEILENHSDQKYIEQFFQENKIPILERLFLRDSTSEKTAGLQSEGKHPELVTLISLLHCAFPDYDFSLGKVKDKK